MKNLGNGVYVGRAVSDDMVRLLFTTQFTERDRALLKNCLQYASSEQGGLPGHSLMLLVAKLLETMEVEPHHLEPLNLGNLMADVCYCRGETCSCE